MKSKTKFHTLPLVSTILILFLIFVLFTVSTVTAEDNSLTITETQITANGSAGNPSIYDNRIVWGDWRNLVNSDIYMYDLSNQLETQITTNESNQFNPYIYGNKIVYVDDRKSDESPLNHDENPENDQTIVDLYMYDLSTGQETQITTNEFYESAPVIYGDKIVWEDDRNGNGDIYMYDLSTGQETQITTNESWQSSPAIYGNRIVWTDARNAGSSSNFDIYMYDLSTGQENQITTNESEQVSPDIYGNRVVWMDYRNRNRWDIYMYDLSTGQENQITTNGSDQLHPAIYGNRIVWMDNRNGPSYGIYMYDLSTGQETQITTVGSGNYPDIYGNRIVWLDPHGYNIYMCTVSGTGSEPTLPVANFSTNSTEGYAPLSVQFTDLSENATGWNWDFGDGAKSSDQNTTHTYSEAGIYNVNFTAINANGTDSKLAVITVLEQPILPVANFSNNVTGGYAPLDVQFNDSSENVTEWNWDFENDGNIDSTEANPVYMYSVPGVYTVNLTAINENGTNSKLGIITVFEQTLPPVANFTSNVTQGYAPLTVQFADLSENATEWKWDFGDRTYSTERNPVHTYFKAGRYTVSLTVKNANGMDMEIKSKYISVSNLKGRKG